MTDGELLEWLVPDGSTVAQGQEIYLLATDKVESAVEAPEAGVITQTGTAGTSYDVGAELGWIEG